jgi:transposase-like protein
MTHSNAPLSVEGRRRLIERCKTRPIAHVAAERGISRACASKWVNRWRRHGDAGKVERYQRILAEEVLYAREFISDDARSAAIAVWNIHYNSHRPHSGAAGQPPASRLWNGVTNVRPSYN